jgi:hypothetical protein
MNIRQGYISVVVSGLFLAAIFFDRMCEKVPPAAMICALFFLLFLARGIALLTASFLDQDEKRDSAQK